MSMDIELEGDGNGRLQAIPEAVENDLRTNGRSTLMDAEERCGDDRNSSEQPGVDTSPPSVPAKQATNRLQNGRFRPGFSGNPRGRPRGRTLRAEIRAILDTVDLNDSGSRLTVRSVVARVLVRTAMAGDLRAAALILANEPRHAEPHRQNVMGVLAIAEDESTTEAMRIDQIKNLARRALDDDCSPPIVCPVDTGRPIDQINHFLETGQLPIDQAQMPEFFALIRAILGSEFNSKEVKRKLVVQLDETFGSRDEFDKAATDEASDARRSTQV